MEIGPGEEYFAHFDVFTDKNAENSFIKSNPSNVVFRFYCQKAHPSNTTDTTNASAVVKQSFSELFAINHAIAVPSERDECYLPFVFELRISRLPTTMTTLRSSAVSVLNLEYTLTLNAKSCSDSTARQTLLIEPTEGSTWVATGHCRRSVTMAPRETLKFVFTYARLPLSASAVSTENPPALRVWYVPPVLSEAASSPVHIDTISPEFETSILVSPVFVDGGCFN